MRDISKGVLAGDQLHRDFLRCLLGVHSGTPNLAVLADVGRYQMVVIAAKHLYSFTNRLVEMDNEQLVSSFLAKRCPWAAHSLQFSSRVLGRPGGFIHSHSRHALRSHHSTISVCQCCCGEAAVKLPRVGKCLRWCQDAAILAPEI